MNNYKILYKFVVIYLYSILFGGFFLKIIGIPNEIGLKFMTILDIVPLLFFFLINPSFQNKGRNIFKSGSFWLLWILILTLLLTSAYLHRGKLTPSIVHIGALLRYIPITYLILSLSSRIKIKNKLLYHLKVITYIILTITSICIVLGEKAEIFLPVMNKDATGLRELANGSYSAVFANTIDLAFLLVLLFIIWCNDIRLSGKRLLLLSIWMGICVFKTGSATATAVFILILFLKLTEKNKSIRLLFVTIFLILGVVLYFKYQYEISLIIDNMYLSRLGLLFLTAPDFISEMSFDTFLGIGNDSDIVLNKVNSYPEKVHMLYYMEDLSAFGDVYWVALLVFHGIIGLTLIGLIFYLIYRGIKKYQVHDSNFDFKRIIKWSYLAIFLLGFMNQVLVVKTFALVFWIIIALAYINISSKTNENTSNKQLCLS